MFYVHDRSIDWNGTHLEMSTAGVAEDRSLDIISSLITFSTCDNPFPTGKGMAIR